MRSFRKVSPEQFDAAVKASCVQDEHDFLESRFLDRNKKVIAKVIRYLDEDGELKPEADLMIAIEKGYVDDYEQDRIDLEELADRVVEINDTLAIRARRNKDRRTRVEKFRQNDHRAAALAQIFAMEATEDPGVAGFRAEVLGGRLIEPDQIESWVKDRAETDGQPTEWVTLPLNDDGTVPVAGDLQPPLETEAVVDSYIKRHAHRRYDFVRFVNPRSWVADQEVRAGGVLDWLRVLSNDLAKRFGWKEAEAVTFVLTGAVPRIYKASWTVHEPWSWWRTRSVITLSLRYWVTPPEAAEIYRSVRNDVLRDDAKPRSITEARATLGVFAYQNRKGHTWADLMNMWNHWPHRDPDMTFTDVRRFTRDSRQSFERITRQPLQWEGKSSD